MDRDRVLTVTWEPATPGDFSFLWVTKLPFWLKAIWVRVSGTSLGIIQIFKKMSFFLEATTLSVPIWISCSLGLLQSCCLGLTFSVFLGFTFPFSCLPRGETDAGFGRGETVNKNGHFLYCMLTARVIAEYRLPVALWVKPLVNYDPRRQKNGIRELWRQCLAFITMASMHYNSLFPSQSLALAVSST